MAAWFWLITWGVWWFIIALGAQGTTPFVGLTGILALLVLFRKRPSFSPDVLILGIFLIWCIATSLWTEGVGTRLLIWDPANDNYAIEAPGLRISLAALLGGFAYWAMHQFSDKIYARTRLAALGGMGLIFIASFIAIPLFIFVIDDSILLADKDASLIQNLTRSANLVVLSIPVFAALAFFRRTHFMLGLGASLIVSLGMNAGLIGAQAAILALIVIAAMSALTYFIGRLSYRILGAGTALLILFMPVVISGVVSGANTLGGDKLPLSFQSRLHSYEYVLDKIGDKWLRGWGVEASKNWDEKETVFAYGMEVEYPVVPGHPHNMGLQLWAETGLIGAVLLALFALLLGERLYHSAREDRASLIAGTGLWAGAMVYAVMSYSLWNDAYWNGIILLASGVLLIVQNSEQGA